jgi:hypothetical protein
MAVSSAGQRRAIYLVQLTCFELDLERFPDLLRRFKNQVRAQSPQAYQYQRGKSIFQVLLRSQFLNWDAEPYLDICYCQNAIQISLESASNLPLICQVFD